MTIQGFFVGINLRNRKWVLCCSDNPKKVLKGTVMQTEKALINNCVRVSRVF